MATTVDLALPGSETGLTRLSCTEITLESGEVTEPLSYPLHEVVYYVVAGYGIITIGSSGAEWAYPVQQNMAIWLSDSADHFLQNDGAAPVRWISFRITVEKSRQETGKEVQRRLVDFADIPVAFLGMGAQLKIAFRGSEIGSERIDAMERHLAPPGGHTPEHYNRKVEAVRYFMRGKGVAASFGELVQVEAGDVAVMPAGARREMEAAKDSFLQAVSVNVYVELDESSTGI